MLPANQTPPSLSNIFTLKELDLIWSTVFTYHRNFPSTLALSIMQKLEEFR
jgi:hypothetical protein